jgi:hypothetical protein
LIEAELQPELVADMHRPGLKMWLGRDQVRIDGDCTACRRLRCMPLTREEVDGLSGTANRIVQQMRIGAHPELDGLWIG